MVEAGALHAYPTFPLFCPREFLSQWEVPGLTLLNFPGCLVPLTVVKQPVIDVTIHHTTLKL